MRDYAVAFRPIVHLALALQQDEEIPMEEKGSLYSRASVKLPFSITTQQQRRKSGAEGPSAALHNGQIACHSKQETSARVTEQNCLAKRSSVSINCGGKKSARSRRYCLAEGNDGQPGKINIADASQKRAIV